MTRILVAAVFVISVATARPASNAASVTYHKDIAPLIADRCVMCHHDGGSAPFALDTYADVKRRAALIATVTTNRYMPPWKADPSNGPFVGQHPLSDAEIALIAEWAAGGAVEGDPSDPRSSRSPEGPGRRAGSPRRAAPPSAVRS